MKNKVLDHGFVHLIDHLGNDLTVVNSARVSFGKRKDNFDIKDANLINYLAKHAHFSPFRHVSFQFHCKVPEFVARQWYKHCIGANYSEKDHAWNEISGRYVDLGEVEFYVPEVFRKQSKNNKQASDGAFERDDPLRKAYLSSITEAKSSYKFLIDAGVAREQARAVLPLCFYTEYYWTASLQAVANFIHLRNHEGAQWEIQEYAKTLQKLVEPICPVSLKALMENQ